MARFTDKEKQMAFFYAEQDAVYYDDTVELTQKCYDQLHNVIVDLFQYHFDAWRGERAAEVRCTIVDAGCGTGTEGLRLLEAFPSAYLVGLDFCKPMLDQFERKLEARYGIDGWRRRCMLSLVDITDETLRGDSIMALLPKEAPQVRAVVTVFALHHYSALDKLCAYRLFYDLLPPGGLFVSGDLFSYESTDLARYAQLHEERWILDSFAGTDRDIEARLATHGKTSAELRSLWIEHLREYNIPLPIEHGWARPATPADGAPIEGEVELLRRAGFAEVGCPFRYFQAGVIWARK